jgi:tetratricopeptide (TPR) repeat protein/tRNA A-37 threonylcarbamoyl transferase component Bud32
MGGNPQVLGLLEVMLDSGKTPEEVCRDCPELLPEVRRRWQAFRLVDAQVGELLPGLRTPPGADAAAPVLSTSDLPQIPVSTADGPPAVVDGAGGIRIPPGGVNPAARYRLGEEIARGGMGVVYRATDTVLGREVAVKVLQEKYAPDSGTARRFADEARISGQLQHPNIPVVHDLGVLADGRPFLAMKLIKGETLEELLKRRGDAADGRGRFVATFEQVCQAVAYAHAHDVIHRDLKPANVMVRAFGEVQVMDWGLAKVLGARPEEGTDPVATTAPTVVRSLRESDDLFTQAGSVLSTPAFMPPEQAAGAVGAIDRRSDVFGLGAVLAVVLTGRPPFVADTSESTRVKAAQGDVGECFARLDACGADPDLVALCRRCLAPRPEDRPPDAGAVAKAVAALRAAADERARRAELERVKAEGEAREAVARAAEQRQRRRMLLAASGIIALVLLAGLTVSLWQMRRAMQAEAAANTSADQARLSAGEAERNAKQAQNERDAKALALAAEQKAREQAFAALRSMTTEVVERKFTQGTALTDDDRAFLRGVIAQFDAFAAIKGDDADSRALRAEGRLRVGWMRYRLGELKEAEQDYEQALSTYKQLAADFPTRPEFRQELAGSHTNRGIVLRATGRLKEAEQDWNEALSIRKQLAADFPSRPEFRQALAGSHNNRGVLRRETGRLREAEEDYDQALSIRKQLAADFPSRPDFRRALAGSHLNRGILRRETGRLKEAEEDYGHALSIQKQLAADFPTRPDFRQELANSHNSRGSLLTDTGRFKEAEEEFDQALSIHKQLAADFPTRPEFRRMLASSHLNRGTLLRTKGRVQEAEEEFDQALTILKQLAADFPNQPDLRGELAGTYVNLATLHQTQGNGAAAKRLLLEGRPHHLVALEANPRHPAYRQFYRKHLAVLIAAHAGLLEQDDAVRTAETCRDLGWNAPADAYDAACFLSLCVPIVAKHDKLDAAQRKEAAQFYGDAAMKLLRDAVSKGYKDAAHIKQDADLGPLRQREDFQKLVAELEGKRT